MSGRRLSDAVAITGATGFIGRHLVRALTAEGIRPLLLARSLPQTAADDPAARWVQADMRDPQAACEAIRRERPAVLIHLAATRRRAPRVEDAVASAELNVAATVRLIAAASESGARRIILLGSAEEYGDQPGPLTESMSLLPNSLYGIAKATVTRYGQAMHGAYGCPVVILRPFTVYGPEQPGDMFIAEAVCCAVRGTAFEMSHGRQRRDLVYVDDVISAIRAAMDAPGIEGKALNLGSGTAVPLREVAQRIWETAGSSAELRIGARPAPATETHDTWADISRAREFLGWEPRVDLPAGLEWTIRWARAQAAE
jgi:nucleoside-diphosphate-sugar epimerase